MPDPPENSDERPSIGVVIAARDSALFVSEMLESLAAQTMLPNEVILYDDASTDGTAAIARKFIGRLPALRIIEGESPAGISAARNRANAAATSDYLAVLDADDFFAPDAIESYTACLMENPEADLIYADTAVFTGDHRDGTRQVRRYPRFRTARQAIRRTLGSPLIPFKHSSMVYRKKTIDDLGGYDENLPIKVDVDLFLRFHATDKNVLKLDRTTSYHRKHARQISTRRLRGIRAFSGLLQTYEPDPWVRSFLYSTRIPSELLKLVLRG